MFLLSICKRFCSQRMLFMKLEGMRSFTLKQSFLLFADVGTSSRVIVHGFVHGICEIRGLNRNLCLKKRKSKLDNLEETHLSTLLQGSTELGSKDSQSSSASSLKYIGLLISTFS